MLQEISAVVFHLSILFMGTPAGALKLKVRDYPLIFTKDCRNFDGLTGCQLMHTIARRASEEKHKYLVHMRNE